MSLRCYPMDKCVLCSPSYYGYYRLYATAYYATMWSHPICTTILAILLLVAASILQYATRPSNPALQWECGSVQKPLVVTYPRAIRVFILLFLLDIELVLFVLVVLLITMPYSYPYADRLVLLLCITSYPMSTVWLIRIDSCYLGLGRSISCYQRYHYDSSRSAG